MSANHTRQEDPVDTTQQPDTDPQATADHTPAPEESGWDQPTLPGMEHLA